MFKMAAVILNVINLPTTISLPLHSLVNGLGYQPSAGLAVGMLLGCSNIVQKYGRDHVYPAVNTTHDSTY